MKPDIVVSILRTIGCFSQCSTIDADNPVWADLTYESSSSMLAACHRVFRTGEKALERYHCVVGKVNRSYFSEASSDEDMPLPLLCGLWMLRLLFDLAMDNCER